MEKWFKGPHLSPNDKILQNLGLKGNVNFEKKEWLSSMNKQI